MFIPMDKTGMIDYISNIAKLPSPRFIKTHLPFHLLPLQLRTQKKEAKIIYVTRNPKDACISFYHHHKMFEGYKGEFEKFCELFLDGKGKLLQLFYNRISFFNYNRHIFYYSYVCSFLGKYQRILGKEGE